MGKVTQLLDRNEKDEKTIPEGAHGGGALASTHRAVTEQHRHRNPVSEHPRRQTYPGSEYFTGKKLGVHWNLLP